MKNLIDSYLDTVKSSRSGKTYETYKQALGVFSDVVGEDALLTKETYIEFLKQTSKMNVATQSLYRSVVKGFYFYAADKDSSVPVVFFQETNKRYALRN